MKLAATDKPIALFTVHCDGMWFTREIIAGLDSTLELPDVGVSVPMVDLYLDGR